MPRIVLPLLLTLTATAHAQVFRAGAVATDISPKTFPRIIAGGFMEGRGDKMTSPLHSRAIVLDDGKTKIAFTIVDTCMMEQALIDEAKAIASQATGIPTDRMMVSATHTHSAPAAMGCLGTRKDDEYAKVLIPKIAESIIEAHQKLQPARIGWASIDDWEHTHNRRWIRVKGKEIADPFGERSGLANMHPGHLSKDVVGPSGPVDPQLSVISLRTLDDKPLAVLANYSMHYYGDAAVSSDYFGLFNALIEQRLGGGVCAMSQGTSGDLMWMDYGAEAKPRDIKAYSVGVADYAMKALANVKHQDHAELGMIEKTLELKYRVPDEKRLAWARPIAAKIENDVPKTKEEVYAREALILHERQKTSVKLQAIRIGDLSIATLPNEVYAITGLKLRDRSPFAMHFNIELANGAEGYIPPPEQHQLGGYTTWPARTAGLHVEAEADMWLALNDRLVKLNGDKSAPFETSNGPYVHDVIASTPIALFRCEQFGRCFSNVLDRIAQRSNTCMAIVRDGGAAYGLPGPGTGSGYGDEARLMPSAFSGDQHLNRAVHLAGGHIQAGLPYLTPTNGGTQKRPRPPLEKCSIALWFWLGHESGASERSGHLIDALGTTLVAHQDAEHRVRLEWGGSKERDFPSPNSNPDLESPAPCFADDWHFAVLIREGDELRVHLDGSEKPLLTGKAGPPSKDLLFGKGLQGKLDEITVWDRAIEPALISKLWKTSRIEEEHARHAVAREERRKRAEAQRALALQQHDHWSASLRFRNTKPNNASAVTAYIISRGPKGDGQAPGDHLGISGTHQDTAPGRLFVFNGNAAAGIVRGQTLIEPGSWNDVTLERIGSRVKVSLNGKVEIDSELPITAPDAKEVFFGKRCDDFAPLEGEFKDASVKGIEASKTEAAAPLEVPDPLSPEDSMKKIHLREGFALSLVAAEPVVLDPVAFDWDEAGHLWVVEMADYPLGMDGKGKPGGRVVKLSEPDATGRYQKRTVIAEGLNFPTGILTWRDGVLVTAAPDILWIKADGSEKKVLFTGFSEGNQQLRVNGLRWGMDGWVYCAGGAHTVNYNKSTMVECKLTGQRIDLGARDFRFKPDTGEFDPQTGPSQFGRARDDWGHWFGVQNSKPLWHYVLQDHYLRRNPNVIPPDPVKLMYPLNPTVYAASEPEKRYHSFNHATTYTSACGINIYRGGTMFDDGKTHAFTCEPFHNLVQHHVLEDDGVSFKATTDTDGKAPDFFASEDRWCRPVMVRDGPDGALYIADMYRLMIEHPQWLPKNGQDELLPHYRKGDDRGRIWKIFRSEPLGGHFPQDLASKSGFARDQAQMRAIWNPPSDVSAIEHLAMNYPKAPVRAQSAWTLHLLGKLTEAQLATLLADPSPRVREQALIIAEQHTSPAITAAIAKLTRDGDPKVRLQLANSTSDPAILSDLLRRDATNEFIASSALRDPALLAHLDKDTLRALTPLIQRSGHASLVDPWIAAMGTEGEDDATLAMLARSAKHRDTVLAKATQWISAKSPIEDQRRALRVLSIARPANAFEQMTSDWTQRTPQARAEIITALLADGGWTQALLKMASPNDFDASQRATLLNHGNKKIVELAKQLFQAEATPARATVLAKFKPALSLKGDATRGKQTFTTAGCIACHQLDGAGLPLGPDLRSVVQHTPEKLFNSILDPSAIIEPGFAAYHCTLTSGEQLYGIVATETSSSLTLKLAGNLTRSVLRSEVKELKATRTSLMPDGLEAALTAESLADLIAYLRAPK